MQTRSVTPSARETQTDRWHRRAEADYALCRALADTHDARLEPSGRAQRVGWEKAGHTAYGILLPDPLPSPGAGDIWYFYYVWGETMLRRTAAERGDRRMLVLAESADDWAALLGQAVRRAVLDSRWEIVPDYTDALGETENVPCGFRFEMHAHAPDAARQADFTVRGRGETPAGAARNACRRYLEAQLTQAGPGQ